jgi:uncharacterized protein (UPF0276 family)
MFMSSSRPYAENVIPPRAGLGLRADHFDAVLQQSPAVGWFEVHSENYFGVSTQAGGRPLCWLEKVRAQYPISLHGVGMSLGSTDPLNEAHLRALKQLIERIEPGLVSEHLSWGSVDGRYFNDLLPMPYSEEALVHLVARIDAVQNYLGRQLLIENVSSYLEYTSSTMPEWEFIAELARRSGCGLLLDVNNVYVNACNHGFDAQQYLQHIPVELVQEIHLAGHTVKQIDGRELLVDTHDRRVCDDVWVLYHNAVKRFGAVPALIEWDKDLPPLAMLLEEAQRADAIREARDERVA